MTQNGSVLIELEEVKPNQKYAVAFRLDDGSFNRITFESDKARNKQEIIGLLEEVRRNLEVYFELRGTTTYATR